MVNRSIVKILVDNGLKVTPQRIGILEVIVTLNNHPTAENVCEYLRLSFPSISISTVYKTLELFSSKGIIKKIYSGINPVRYDGISEKHHHLYCPDSDRIEDYYDEELNKMLYAYMKKKRIQDFTIKDIKVQICGKFTEQTK